MFDSSDGCVNLACFILGSSKCRSQAPNELGQQSDIAHKRGVGIHCCQSAL
jgi:hypothetical protein